MCRSNRYHFEVAENYGMMPRFARRIMRAVKTEPSTLPVLSVASLLAFEDYAWSAQGCLIRISYRLMHSLQANSKENAFASGRQVARKCTTTSWTMNRTAIDTW
jgi:hypothetical protein